MASGRWWTCPASAATWQDHLALSIIWASAQPVSLAAADSTWQRLRYITMRSGPLASNVAEAGGFVRTQGDYAAPDLQFHFVPGYFRNHGFDHYDGHAFTLAPTLVRAVSTGTISLRTADPLAPPQIQANYLSDPSEMATMIHGVRLARDIIAGAAFDRYRGPGTPPRPRQPDQCRPGAVCAPTCPDPLPPCRHLQNGSG